MRIINVTRQKAIGETVKQADSFLGRLMGLLATERLPAGAGLIIKPCNSVHTFGMRYPIDVVFVDKSNIVIAAVSRLKPSRLALQRRAEYVVELPAGTIEATLTQPGDKLELQAD